MLSESSTIILTAKPISPAKTTHEEIIKYLKDEKKLECEDITNIITNDNFGEHDKTKSVIKYFYWTPLCDALFKSLDDESKTSCLFIYDGQYFLLEQRMKYSNEIKRMFDHLVTDSSCMICSSDGDIYVCTTCQFLICYKCLGNTLVETFQRTGKRQEKCPQCRTLIENLPIKLVYVNNAHPELSDVLTEEERKEIEKADNRVIRNKKRNKIKKIKKKIKQIQAKIADIGSNPAFDSNPSDTRSSHSLEEKAPELLEENVAPVLLKDI